jgi:hypothetical protein
MPKDLLLERSANPTGYRLTTASQSYEHVRRGEDPWIALGNFLDDWRSATPDQRSLLVADPIRTNSRDPNRRWAALFAASVDWLCWTSEPRVERPAWLADDVYVLPAPWYVTDSRALRAWQLAQSPTPFRMRRIYTDAGIVARA